MDQPTAARYDEGFALAAQSPLRMIRADPPSDPPGGAIGVVDVVKTYGRDGQVAALQGVSLEIAAGQRVAILGKSGSGKSTLLNLIGGLDRPTAGEIRVGPQSLSRLSSRQAAMYRLQTIGMIFQSYNLIPSRDSLQNVELPMVFAGRSPAARREAAREALVSVGLEERLDHRPAQLSGGEQQRVAIARALVNDPAVLLADEPTGNLDSRTAEQVIELLMHHVAQRRTTFVLVTHDEPLARRCADLVLWMRDGRLVA